MNEKQILLRLLEVLEANNVNLSEYTWNEFLEYSNNPNWVNKYGIRRPPLMFNYKEWIQHLYNFEVSDCDDKVLFLIDLKDRVDNIKKAYLLRTLERNQLTLNYIDTCKATHQSISKLIKKLGKKNEYLKSKKVPKSALQMALFLYYLEESKVRKEIKGREGVENECLEFGYQKSHKNVYNILRKIKNSFWQSVNYSEIQDVRRFLIDFPKADEKAKNDLDALA